MYESLSMPHIHITNILFSSSIKYFAIKYLYVKVRNNMALTEIIHTSAVIYNF